MQNSYIVDTFLSGALWAIMIYLFFDLRARIALVDEMMSAATLSAAMTHSAKTVSLVAIPFCVAYLFLAWRFYGLMIASASWGYGGMGMLTIIIAVGMPMIWLEIMLILVPRSPFAAIGNRGRDLRQDSTRSTQ